jgi:hypothetical protein
VKYVESEAKLRLRIVEEMAKKYYSQVGRRERERYEVRKIHQERGGQVEIRHWLSAVED